MLIDTKEFLGGVRTTFKLSPCFGEFEYPPLQIERGTHSPSRAESLAPFCQDPTQRIVTLIGSTSPWYLVFRVKSLLDLLESREGSEIGWDEWKGYVIIPSINPYNPEHIDIWVSGCRLFCLDSTDSSPGSRMKVYDFSLWGWSKYLSNEVDENLGAMKHLSSTGAVGFIPWGVEDFFGACSGHGSVIFSPVGAVIPPLILG